MASLRRLHLSRDLSEAKEWIIRLSGLSWWPPVVKNLPCNAGDMGSIPGVGTKISHVRGQLSPPTPPSPQHCAHPPQLESLGAAPKDPELTKTKGRQPKKKIIEPSWGRPFQAEGSADAKAHGWE